MIDRRRLLGTGGLAFAGLAGGCTTTRPSPAATSPDLILDLQERSFRFFWDTSDPATGWAPDRWPTPSFASIAAIGFALTAYPIGVVNGWITRDQARARTLATLEWLAAAPQGPGVDDASGYKGFFYHFLGVTKGLRFARTELSTIDTALLIASVLFVGSWFDDRGNPAEARIRALADQLYTGIDWTWIVPRSPFLAMGWHPESGFIPSDWNIYNEGMLMYLLAIGSPTHPLPAATWSALTQRFAAAWTNRWGEPYLHYPPLFVHQYSHVWVDFRGIQDSFIKGLGLDYFENSRRAVRNQRRYGMANPGGWIGYDKDCWGWTACDGPGDFTLSLRGKSRAFFSYSERGPGTRDDGTIAPTAAAASIAFEPELATQCIRTMHQRYGGGIYGQYGFLDAFNPTLTDTSVPLQHGQVVPGVGWVDKDYLGIDQGPIVAMIENQRTGLIWKTMQRNPHLRRGLERAGFRGGWLN